MSDVRPAFLLSQPRAGSTLLQRLLAAHSEVATVAEPWFLLPPLYALRERGVYAEYGHQITTRAISGLCEQLPGGRGDYLEAVAAMARSLYSRASPPTAKVFLDKTPRYGLVVDDLLATFPEAAFIVLYRNPLAVVASISSTFDGGSWKPYHHKQDLYLLPERLLEANLRSPESFTTVRYEDLLTEPKATLQRLVGALGLDWESSIMDSFSDVSLAGHVGDPTGVEDYDQISREPLTKWQQSLSTPVRKAWVRRYLRWLGAERLQIMGYELGELMEQLTDAPTTYSQIAADSLNAAKGVIWSLTEVESARDKLRRLPRWRELFTHS